MPRLIEVQDPERLRSHLRISRGDVLWFAATGGRIKNGTEAVVSLLGPLVQSVIGPDGAVISPAGPPTAVLFVARNAGTATLEIITGDPWAASRTTIVEILVDG